ncbi:HAMP domain-containing sensor histidine kinase [Alicyclobacillus acidocaldarius]|uniref:histidine kinase n=1 Tax=Alicyclobacillus acidocaldarius subsp. acidocaldarius (strain ATCC 27009 / DSM 446 / BCRC 14685 / JCM 5260 / KCTC 1825 / NBRC 15652 / NCIMB 11725 / NRRL B-14509 / 104-IA) TaxID=521098 RepID=C8WT59_ALIAD|nr:HAMP domain-containing sensor histidine kinase [Alicyclobacillus acidocaldarius]ACV59573.1 PAS/PAC sensor signal transduction histidine kinase [Alicyclobacillus acidocaldarius subsp. acidocaldarius DSM 446]
MIPFAIGLGVGLAIGALFALWQMSWFRSLRRYLLDAMDAIVQGRYDVRMYEYRSRPAEIAIFRHFNRMAERIQETLADLSQERDILRHILQNMTTGVIYLRSDGQVQMVNHAAERLFRRPVEQWKDRDHWTVFRNYQLGSAIDHALLFGTPWSGEFQIRDGVTVAVRLVPISAAPRMRNKADGRHDVLMLVNDVSEWRRLERMRSDFVANVSHELKTPIAAIRGFAETLLDGDVDEEAREKFLRTIYEESLRMGNLVSDLLELSKLEASDSHVDPVAVDLYEVLVRAVDRVRPVANEKEITIELPREQRLHVWAEPDLLLQVFLNLLTNAIHYSPPKSRVCVTWDVLVDRVKVHVKDNGIGIPKESLPRVFERFYRVHKDRSRASGGTGLGLAIVKHIVTALGGEVGVESEEGKGSDFWFTLSRLDARP